MAVLPAAGYFTNASRTNGEAKQAQDDLLAFVRQTIGGDVPEALTIASGVVTPTRGIVAVDTEGAASTDDLTNILTSVLPDGSLLIVQSVIGSRVVTVKNGSGGAGQLLLAGGADVTLSDPTMMILLQRRGTDWREIDRSYGANLGGLRSYLGLGRGALVRRNSDLTLPSGTPTTIAWGVEDYDTDNLWSAGAPSTFVVPAGVSKMKFLANVALNTVSASSAGIRGLTIAKNGVGVEGGGRTLVPGIAANPLTLYLNASSAILSVSPGDTFSVIVEQTTGVNGAVQAGVNTWFACEIIR